MKYSGIKFLDSLTDFGIKLGLDKIFFLLKKLGDPHLTYPSVLIAGTNGKGSVAKFLATILQENGYKTGLYTSPHLVRIEERIKINDRDIPTAVFDDICLKIKKIIEKFPLEKTPTYFEVLTAVAFYYFREEKIDILVCEVGMGGRYDATNVLPSFLEVITPVSYDHAEFLGNSIQEISKEKAGIIKDNSFLVVGKQKKEAEETIKKYSVAKKARSSFYPSDFFCRTVSSSFEDGLVFNFNGLKQIKNIKISIPGQYQVHNASVALQSALIIDKYLLPLNEKLIKSGLKTSWPARVQILSRNPLIILDGAHNYDGAKSLMKTLGFYFPGEKFIFLTGILKDKNYTQMLKIFSSIASFFIFTTPQNPRAVLPQELQKVLKDKNISIPSKVIEKPDDAFAYLKKISRNEKGVICGSLYLAGDILKAAGF